MATSSGPTSKLAALRARISDDELRNFPTTRELLLQIRDALEAPDAVVLLDALHGATVERNVVYDVRGAGIYIEDGNEVNAEAAGGTSARTAHRSKRDGRHTHTDRSQRL